MTLNSTVGGAVLGLALGTAAFIGFKFSENRIKGLPGFGPAKVQEIDPIQGDTKAPDMIENHLHVERFGPVHKFTNHADGTVTEENYWEALISDDRNRHVYFVKCTPETEEKWRRFEKWAKGKRIIEINEGKADGP